MKDHETLTLVRLMMHDDATGVVLNGPALGNAALPWSTRVEIVAQSCLAGLRRITGRAVV